MLSILFKKINHAAPSAAATSKPKTEIQTILAAITNLSNSTPPAVTKPKMEM